MHMALVMEMEVLGAIRRCQARLSTRIKSSSGWCRGNDTPRAQSRPTVVVGTEIFHSAELVRRLSALAWCGGFRAARLRCIYGGLGVM
jgi:hypothetical protein